MYAYDREAKIRAYFDESAAKGDVSENGCALVSTGGVLIGLCCTRWDAGSAWPHLKDEILPHF